jgi:hypothetical protein
MLYKLRSHVSRIEGRPDAGLDGAHGVRARPRGLLHGRGGAGPSHLPAAAALPHHHGLGPARTPRCLPLCERPADGARRAHRPLALVGRGGGVQPRDRALSTRPLRRAPRAGAHDRAALLALSPLRRAHARHAPRRRGPSRRRAVARVCAHHHAGPHHRRLHRGQRHRRVDRAGHRAGPPTQAHHPRYGESPPPCTPARWR